MVLHKTLITLKDFKINALRARVFIFAAPDKCKRIGGFSAMSEPPRRPPFGDAKIFKKDTRNCLADAPKTFALTIKSSIMPLANGSVSPPQEAD